MMALAKHLQDPLSTRGFPGLKRAFAAYAAAIPLSHFTLPDTYVWHLALLFLLLMLPPSPSISSPTNTPSPQ